MGDHRASAPRRARAERSIRTGGSRVNFTRSFDALRELASAGCEVSARVVDASSGHALFLIDDHVSLPVADAGRLLLLVEVAIRLEAGVLEPDLVVDYRSASGVRAEGDEATPAASGLWRFLDTRAFSVEDLCVLAAKTADAYAINLLIDLVGLASVNELAESLGLRHTALLDRAVFERGLDDAPQMSIASALELTWLLGALVNRSVATPRVCETVLDWISETSDPGLVTRSLGLLGGFRHDAAPPVSASHLVGVDAGSFTECGIVEGPGAHVVYAVTVRLPAEGRLAARFAMADALATLGRDVLEHVHIARSTAVPSEDAHGER